MVATPMAMPNDVLLAGFIQQKNCILFISSQCILPYLYVCWGGGIQKKLVLLLFAEFDTPWNGIRADGKPMIVQLSSGGARHEVNLYSITYTPVGTVYGCAFT
jgi:hypothetical protein